MLYRYIAYPELYSEPPGAQLGMRYEIGPIRLAGGQLNTIGSVTSGSKSVQLEMFQDTMLMETSEFF